MGRKRKQKSQPQHEVPSSLSLLEEMSRVSASDSRNGVELAGSSLAKTSSGSAGGKTGVAEAVDREKTCPMLLRVFCSTSRHSPINEYNRGNVPANELQIYTWKDASLKELTTLIKEVNPEAQSRGTFFDFAVVYPNLSNRLPHFNTRPIGTTVAGQRGPDDSKTLSQCRFIIGDFLDVAITPPVVGRGNDRFGPRRDRDRVGRTDRGFRPY